MPDGLIEFLRGGTMIAFLAIGLFFLRYFVDSRDRLFLYFSAAFILMAISQIAVMVFREADHNPYAYLIRFVAFILIILGIVEKNLPAKSKSQSADDRDSEV